MKDMIERLKEKGVTLTPQRLAVVEFLKKNASHPTVDDIHRAIQRKYPTMSMATVYSTLELLKEHGEIQELSIRKRGKACFDPSPKLHHHLLCQKCDKVVNIEFECPDDCPIIKEKEIGGCRVEEVQAYVYGLCPDCLKMEDNVNDKP